MAVGSESAIKFYNKDMGKCVKTITGHTGLIRDLLLMEDGNILFSGSDDKLIKMWDLSKSHCIRTFKGHNHSANKIILYQPGILCSASDDSNIKFWDIKKGTCIHTLTKHKGWVIWITITKDG